MTNEHHPFTQPGRYGGFAPACTCGWRGAPWHVYDGSAQQDAYNHARRATEKESNHD